MWKRLGCVVALVLALGAAPAWAQPELLSSSPGDGATVTRLPGSVSLRFSEAVAEHPITVGVLGPDGIRVDVGEPTVSGDTVSQPVSGAGVPGRYVLAYRVAGTDGHPTTEEVGFTVEPAADAGASTRALVVGAVALLVLAGAVRRGLGDGSSAGRPPRLREPESRHG